MSKCLTSCCGTNKIIVFNGVDVDLCRAFTLYPPRLNPDIKWLFFKPGIPDELNWLCNFDEEILVGLELE